MKKSRIKIELAFYFMLMLNSAVFGGWDIHTHINTTKEAVRIQPVFEYEMCVYYKDHLLEGVIEGEIHYKYLATGKHPNWISDISENEVPFLNGIPINDQNIDSAAYFFADQLIELKKDISALEKPYGQIMFELGYFLHSINNSLIPEYHGGKCHWQEMASNTDSIDIRTSNITKVTDLKGSLIQMFKDNLNLRKEWTQMAEAEDKEGFIQIAQKAHEQNIYHTASLIQYVLDGCLGPAHPEARKHVAAHHEERMAANGGRKPDF